MSSGPPVTMLLTFAFSFSVQMRSCSWTAAPSVLPTSLLTSRGSLPSSQVKSSLCCLCLASLLSKDSFYSCAINQSTEPAVFNDRKLRLKVICIACCHLFSCQFFFYTIFAEQLLSKKKYFARRTISLKLEEWFLKKQTIS